jgi:hypothetical protein
MCVYVILMKFNGESKAKASGKQVLFWGDLGCTGGGEHEMDFIVQLFLFAQRMVMIIVMDNLLSQKPQPSHTIVQKPILDYLFMTFAT